MSVNKRRNKYKTDKEFDKEQSEDGFVSKTQLKNQALDLKKFGLELAKLKTSIIENLPVGEVTLKSLTDYQKMTTNLARKRHLMFIGKCLRSESESAIREYLDNKERANISTMQRQVNQEPSSKDVTIKTQANDSGTSSELNPSNKNSQFVDALLIADGEKIELILEKHQQLERQSLRQIIRNCNGAKNGKKKQTAKAKLLEYLKLNGVTDFG
ncbi:MAG: hypothetical protein COA86_02455 [Kangiella sp.]|nr:MAG: hypothetical protein COA86_02455 [Kangiella sp.]